MQGNYSEIRKDAYFLNQPRNFNQGYEVSMFFGNPDKLFLTLALGSSFNKEKKGIYDSLTTKASASIAWFGAMISYEFYRNQKRKFLNALYFSSGVNHHKLFIYSKGNGPGKINQDTTFFYESSNAGNLLICGEIMAELFNISKKTVDFPVFPLTLRIGYNYQFTEAKWKQYKETINYPVADRKINQGGFYFLLGINFWLQKGAWKNKNRNN